MEDLSGSRDATSCEVLAGRYFKEIDAKVQAEPSSSSRPATSVEYVGGSVEAACALGMADGIVDLVESGDTMRAAGLHAIATLMNSEAVLITPSKPHESLTPQLEHLIPLLTARFAGVVAAKRYVLIHYNVHESKLHDATAITPGRRSATVSKLESGEGWLAVSAMVEKKAQAQTMDRLSAVGAEDILVLAIDNCRV